jgi:CPA2 family monovalent cation:H+ antiporter-2
LEDQPDLRHGLLFLVAMLISVPLFQRLGLGTVLAYLTAGVLIGPSGLALLDNAASIEAYGELGVVFLLFSIGLEINFERLRLFGRGVYGLALSQMVVTTLALAAIAWRVGLEPIPAVIVGGSLAFSSTAVVLQLLSERGQLGVPLGRTAIALVLLQDLAVAPMIVFVNAGGAGTGLFTELGGAAIKFGIFLILVAFLERIALRPLLRLAADASAPEVFTGAALLLVLGLGWITEELGLSMALGAFLAGMLVADTEFRHQVAADIQPFRGLLLGLFFATVGMRLDLNYAIENRETLALLIVGLVAIKTLIIFGLAVAFRLPPLRAAALGGLLAQGSEFAFILFALAADRGVLSGEHEQLLTVAVAVSLAFTPLGAVLFDRLFPAGAINVRSILGNLERETDEMAGHVVVAGFGQVGMAVARYLAGERVPMLILDLTPKRVAASRSRGLPVFFGNAARIDVLRNARLERANALVITVPDAPVAEQITAIARRSFRHLPICVRAPDESWIDRLKEAGADAIVLEGVTTGLELAERVMLVYDPAKRNKKGT